MEILNESFNAFDRPYSLFHYLAKLNHPNISRPKFYATFHKLKNQKLIDISESNGKSTITITKNGKKKLLQYNLEKLRIQKPKVWDKKWRVVIFDIPEKRKIARDFLRRKFNELGLYKIQDSVWVHPFDISDIIESLVTIYEIRPFVKLIIADSISEDEQIKKIFSIE